MSAAATVAAAASATTPSLVELQAELAELEDCMTFVREVRGWMQWIGSIEWDGMGLA